MRKAPTVGTRVRLTGEFLRSTGQMAGGEGQSKWLTVACDCGLCKRGEFVAVNQPSYDEPSRPRHLNVHNLDTCR